MFKLIDKLGDNVNLLHTDPETQQITCDDGSLKYVPYKKSFNDNATSAYNKEFINNYEQLKSTMVFYFTYLKEIRVDRIYLKGGNAMFVYYTKSKMYPLCNTDVLSRIFHNADLAADIVKNVGIAFTLSDVDIGVELSATDYDDEAKYRSVLDTIYQVLLKIQTQLNVDFSAPENETVRARYIAQLVAMFNEKRTTDVYAPQPSAIDVYDVGEGSATTKVADALYDDLELTRIADKEREPIKYKETPYTTDDFAYVNGVDWVAIKTNGRKSLYRFAPKGTNWHALTFNNMLAFSFNSFNIMFDLFRIKLNIQHKTPPKQFTFCSEVLDVGIHNKHDIAYTMTHDANVNGITNPTMITMDANGSSETFHMVNKLAILLDLVIIMFFKTTLPWTDVKYDKRITRFFFLFATIPELDSVYRFIISTLVTVWMKLHNTATLDSLPTSLRNIVHMYFAAQPDELNRVLKTNIDELYTVTEGSAPIYNRMTIPECQFCDVLVKFCIVSLKSIKKQFNLSLLVNQFALLVPVINQQFVAEFTKEFEKFLQISIKYAVCFYIMKSQITSYADLYKPLYKPSYKRTARQPPTSYGSLYKGTLWGGKQTMHTKELYDVTKQDYENLKQLQTRNDKSEKPIATQLSVHQEESIDSLRGEDNLRGEDSLRGEDNLRGEDSLQGEDNLQIEEPSVSLTDLKEFNKKINDYLFARHAVTVLPSSEVYLDADVLDN